MSVRLLRLWFNTQLCRTNYFIAFQSKNCTKKRNIVEVSPSLARISPKIFNGNITLYCRAFVFSNQSPVPYCNKSSFSLKLFSRAIFAGARVKEKNVNTTYPFDCGKRSSFRIKWRTSDCHEYIVFVEGWCVWMKRERRFWGRKMGNIISDWQGGCVRGECCFVIG